MNSSRLSFARLCVLIVIGISIAGCTRLSGQTRDTEQNSHAGFAVGEMYEVITPMKAARWGERLTLVSQVDPAASRVEPNEVAEVHSGVRIQVVKIRESNTLTRGMEIWPEGVFRSGALTGRSIALSQPGVAQFLRLVSAKKP